MNPKYWRNTWKPKQIKEKTNKRDFPGFSRKYMWKSIVNFDLDSYKITAPGTNQLTRLTINQTYLVRKKSTVLTSNVNNVNDHTKVTHLYFPYKWLELNRMDQKK